jgi:hypothetical protein
MLFELIKPLIDVTVRRYPTGVPSGYATEIRSVRDPWKRNDWAPGFFEIRGA